MRKTGIRFMKNLHYLLLVGVLALGLITIVGSGGGGGGDGAATTTDTTTDTTAPEDVTSLSAQPGDSKVSLSWTASANSESDLAGQKVYYSSDGGTTYTTAESALSASATSYEVTGLTNGTSYKFKVTCYDEVPNESSGATVSCYANAALSDSDMPVQSGLTDGGVARTATQTMTGTVPNPTGSSDTYGGKAYLVLNGDRIPIDVTRSGSSSSSGLRRIIYKDGKEYDLDDTKAIDPAILSKLSARNGDDVTWVFSVTFSINAGTNTISIEVYDLNDTLFARTEQWEVVGTVEPTSMVVTLWWNTNLTDIDLHVAEVEDDTAVAHCYYGNMSAGDMVLDYDDVDGYGPEHITVDNVTGTKTYEIRVYYFADHNDSDTTTATTAYITASVNGETKISDSHSMTSESTTSTWTTGSHIWDVGELEVSGANVYTVTLDDPDLSNFPEVTLTVTVEDTSASSSSARGEHVSGLTSSNFYVINAGTSMSPVTVTEGSSSYTLTYTDVTCGARDLYVYVYVPAEDDTPMKGGLSNTKTYGASYALLVGIEDYPGTDNDLNYCNDDVDDMYTALTANKMWESAKINKDLKDSFATKSAILNKIAEIAGLMKKYDAFLFHFSGHGSDGADDDSQYLCAYEDDAWISVTDLATKLSSIPDPGSNITNVFVTLDACFSGNFIGKGMGREATRRCRPFVPQREAQPYALAKLAFSRDMRDLTGTNLFVMTAVDGDHSAWDVPSPLENGLFTYYLVKGLTYTNISDAPANSNKDVWVTGEEAYNYLMPKAKEYCEENIYDANDPDYADAEQISQYYPDLSTKSRLVYTW
ncbi:MAG: caspase family protein [Deltaproteobacteria bacterium]|nr:caspase family protein [Deltaproteobacteria bacterium]